MRTERNNAKAAGFLSRLPARLKLNRMPMICAAVIPCHNEGAGIAALVSALRQHVSFVLVVDDGSADETALLAKGAGATVIRHERNRGKGAALRSGLSQLFEQGLEWAVTLDGDGQHAPEDLPALLRCGGQTGARLVIGNRMDNARAMPWLRRQVNRWMSRKLSQRAGRQLPDTQSGSDSFICEPGRPCPSRQNVSRLNPKL